MSLPKLVVILGPTACGKSGLGVALAKKYGGEIVSADSRQVYRGLDLGTGKVTAEEMEGVPHHLLDVAEPGDGKFMAGYLATTVADDLGGGGANAPLVYQEGSLRAYLDSDPVTVVPAAQAGNSDETSRQGMVEVITHAARAFMPLAELVDLAEEKKRLEKELAARKNELAGLESRLNNPSFVSKAPAQVVEAEKERAVQLTELVAKLEGQLKGM